MVISYHNIKSQPLYQGIKNMITAFDDNADAAQKLMSSNLYFYLNSFE